MNSAVELQELDVQLQHSTMEVCQCLVFVEGGCAFWQKFLKAFGFSLFFCWFDFLFLVKL